VAACGDKTTALIIDPIALAAIIILTLIMAFGVKESFWFNVGTVVVSVLAILLCIFMGEQLKGGGQRLMQWQQIMIDDPAAVLQLINDEIMGRSAIAGPSSGALQLVIAQYSSNKFFLTTPMLNESDL
jgi:hypothetical protein